MNNISEGLRAVRPQYWGRLVCKPSLCCGAATRTRTGDLLITSELLYQLSYGGDAMQ